MVVVLAAAGACLLLAASWIVVIYNGLRRLQYACGDAWSGVDVQLQRRADLVPNLVAVVQAYAAHERAVLDAITAARARAIEHHGPTTAHAAAEDELGVAVARTVALSEAYPDLAASEQFLSLQATLAHGETQIAAAREIYNGNVAAYRDRLQQVPSVWVARTWGFADRPMFGLERSSERAPGSRP